MKPILFNTEMVKAILDGRKTATRRVAFPHKNLRKFSRPDNPDAWWFRGRAYTDWNSAMRSPQGVLSLCKYKEGDVLYVRETWARLSDWVDVYPKEGLFDKYVYRADLENDPHLGGWRPSIHMPKEAARIFLRVTDIRVERLQEMPHDAPKKEGIHYCECPDGFTWNSHTTMQDCYINPMGAMKALWNSTVKKSDLETYGWDANPWVWVIGFERISREETISEETTLR